MKNSLTIILLIVILAIIAIVLTVLSGYFEASSSTDVNVTVEKDEYTIAEPVKIKIQNNSEEKVCFSSESCYPYYLERLTKEKNWEAYSYSECKTDNLVQVCMEPKEIKAFELVSVFSLFPDLIVWEKHRIAIPICINCNVDEPFEADEWFYSKEFIIK